MSDLLQLQIEYYRARAPEYDDWFYRRRRYDQGDEHTRQWQAEAQQVRDQLHSASGFEHILELAPGTGIWTEELIKIGEGLTALDASPEMININRAKLLSDQVDISSPTCSSGGPLNNMTWYFSASGCPTCPAKRWRPSLILFSGR